jgi:hypothetical protein
MATESSPPLDREQEKQTAYMILVAGGLTGGVLALGSIIAAYWWWAPLLAWLRDGDREKLWQPLAGIGGLLAGLAIMFATFQAARRFERVDVTLRRVLYGYNAILTGFLLLLLLVVVNAFIHVQKPLPYDTTQGGFYSLSERTKQYFTALETPVEVYLMLDPEDNSGAYDGMKTILTQMEALNPRYFHWEEVNFEGNPSRIRDLKKRFKNFAVRPGVLVAYGDKPEENHSFIGASELSNFDFADRGNPKRSFNGEPRLIQELYFLGEGQRKPIVYFTQGHGEPELSDRSEEGLSTLVQRLTQANYDVRPLVTADPDPMKNQVPPEADVVVIAGPKRAMKDLIPALTKYMSPSDPKAKKGKLVVLLGPTGADRQRGNQMVKTELEDFLRSFGVDATSEQVLMLRGLGGEVPARGNRPYPEAVIIAALQTAAQERQPLAMLMKDDRPLWIDVRHLEPMPPAGPGGPRFQAEPLLATAGFVWTEGDMNKPSLETWQRIATDAEERQKRLKRDPVPVLIAVSESAPTEDPHGTGKPNEGRTPRLVVFGCSTIASNHFTNPQSGGLEFDLIRGSVDWCRERYTQIGVEPKSYSYFAMPKTASLWNLFYLPLAAMALGVFGLGLIVWNIRRS